MLNIAVLASGRGTNLQSIIDAVKYDQLKVNIKLLVSDKEDAHALKRAEKQGIKSIFIDPKQYKINEEYEKELIRILEKEEVKLICMAGFMRILSPYFIRHFRNRIMNIHPSLLPSFPGLNAQKQALDYGVKISGCTVHFANEGMDAGPVILQSSVLVKDDDSEETLAKRILKEEHKIYPKAICLFSEGKIKLEGRKVKIIS